MIGFERTLENLMAVVALLFCLYGLFIFTHAKTVFHEFEAFLVWIIAAVLFTGAAIRSKL